MIIVQAQQEGRLAAHRFPAQLAPLINRGRTFVPHQLERAGMTPKFRDRCRIGTQMIGPVETPAGEKWIRRQGLPFG